MLTGDIVGVLAVYGYVLLLLFLTEKLIASDGLFSRKVLHIGAGNIIFILPLFQSRWVMTFVAAAPFIVLTFLISPYSPLKTVSKTSSEGHGLGLVYYAISWTVLAFLFFHRMEVIAVGIVAMSYGDGFASLVGQKWGVKEYSISGDKKRVTGTIAMFLSTLIMTVVALWYFEAFPTSLYLLPLVPLVATIAEGGAPRGLDNLSVSLSAAIFYYLLF